MSQMDVILLQRIEALGQMGDVVKVKPGFARNYLLPQKKALRATKENMAFFEKQRAQLEAQNLKQRADAEAVAAKMGDKFAVVIIRQAGESGMLYGSVSSRDIAVAVTEGGVTVTRAQVLLDQPIKALGVYTVAVKLARQVTANLKLWVVAK
jgi:large subunit ribosomal protein L9